MKKTLSFWKPAYRLVSWVGRGLHSALLYSKFDLIPTEKNLLISLWHARNFYRHNRAEDTVYDFLDDRVRIMEETIVNPQRKRKVRELSEYFLKAVKRAPVRKKVVEFLESPLTERDYLPVLKAMRSAWRIDGELVEADKEPGQEAEKQVEMAGVVAGAVEGVVARLGAGEGAESEVRCLNAKTYVIAAQLYFEVEGRPVEFEVLSRNMPELIQFVQERFGAGKLPGTFENFKGYSYKPILNGRSGAKKGQLKVPFRQIRDHPEIFGDAVAARAGEILKVHFS